MGDLDRWGGGRARRMSGSGDGRDHWDRTTQDFIRTISNPRGEEERRWRRGGGWGGPGGAEAYSSSSAHDTRYDDSDRGYGARARAGSRDSSSEHYGRRDRAVSPPYDYRRRTPEGREGSRDRSWRSRSPPRSRSRSPTTPRPPGLPASLSERERELRRLERDTLRIGAADAAAAAAASEVDLREVLDIGRKAKEAVASGLVRNLKNAAARTLQSQHHQQQHQHAPDALQVTLTHPHSQHVPPFPGLVPNTSRGSITTAMGETSGPHRSGEDFGVAQQAGSGESRDNLRAGNYLVATWDAMTDGHQYDGVISQIGAYLPHGVSYVKQFVDEKILPENMDRYVVMPGGKVFMTFERGPIIPIATTEPGLKEFLDFLERYVGR